MAELLARLEAADRVLRAVPATVGEAVKKALDEARIEYMSQGGGPSVDLVGAQRIVQSMNAARAQCWRRNLSDEARLKAVDKARRLGALAGDFDVSRLPWKDPETVQRQPKAVSVPEAVRQPPDLLALQPRILTEHVGVERARRIAGRLQRLYARVVGVPEATAQPIARPMADGSLWVEYATGDPAIQGDNWAYPFGVARQGDLFYRPGEGEPFVDLGRPGDANRLWESVLERVEDVFGADVARQAEAGVAGLGPGEVTLALMELEHEIQRKGAAGSQRRRPPSKKRKKKEAKKTTKKRASSKRRR
jgi:hypothetical protein